MDKKKVLIGLSIFLTFVLLYFLFDSSSNKSDSEKEKKALAALMGGGGKNSGDKTGSIFGSNFWEAGVPDKAIDTSNVEKAGNDTGILDPASEGNPLNPQTGQAYPDSVMNQFTSLREKFPQNKLIPRRLTAEQKAEENVQKQVIAEIQGKVALGKASTDEVNKFYDYQSKSIDDRLELLNYILENQGASMDSDIKAKFTNILDLNKKQKEANEAARAQALNPSVNQKR
jgi:hypothetical protein